MDCPRQGDWSPVKGNPHLSLHKGTKGGSSSGPGCSFFSRVSCFFKLLVLLRPSRWGECRRNICISFLILNWRWLFSPSFLIYPNLSSLLLPCRFSPLLLSAQHIPSFLFSSTLTINPSLFLKLLPIASPLLHFYLPHFRLSQLPLPPQIPLHFLSGNWYHANYTW